MWPLPCTHVYSRAYIQAHTHIKEWISVNHVYDVYVCVWVGWGWREGPKSTRGRIQWIESQRKRAGVRERSLALLICEWWQFFRVETWPSFNLSILRHENGRKGRTEGGWGDQSRNLLLSLVPDWFLLYFTFIWRQTIKLTYLLTRTQWMAKTEKMSSDSHWTGPVPGHKFIPAIWRISVASNK